ncbi:hypothetical protein JX265_009059 [Neoarthrinium moseri]|uniref:Uncharacterized protein n=1 Tax=Neoarthrinium moseri TaxID=1658444 RepID=A0A9Q0AJQ6_9PEZI|nr:uncharacterized protein JN550_011444 [Neoarthrinium moseri]KAI1846638.1 hypothetical protein JX266_007211 [Neoarthrinium moseri]KAI1860596.1 hypothetical protein JN550_011444 [Neoarthrinium moseri]KAI1863013.1 hypothetical protein JX265_009059 [Neoarthrinium moseri]
MCRLIIIESRCYACNGAIPTWPEKRRKQLCLESKILSWGSKNPELDFWTQCTHRKLEYVFEKGEILDRLCEPCKRSSDERKGLFTELYWDAINDRKSKTWPRFIYDKIWHYIQHPEALWETWITAMEVMDDPLSAFNTLPRDTGAGYTNNSTE